MKEFRFPLQPVLDLRRREKHRAEQRFAAKARDHAATEDLLRLAKVELEASLDCLDEARRTLPLSMQKSFLQHLESQKGRLMQLRAAAQQSAAELERRRGVLLEARHDCRLMERLCEERLAEYRREAARKEERDVEDFVNCLMNVNRMDLVL